MLIQQDPSLKEVFEKHPAWQPVKATPFAFPQMNEDGDPPNQWQLAAAGWGFALLDPASVQADDGAGLTRGIIGLVNKGQPRKPDDWGALRAWAWAAGRALDYLETDPSVDAKHVGIEGVSRYGKAALVTMAFDQRFAMVLVGSSGKGGATLLRRNFGEGVENLATGEYYWMAGNFLKYDAAESTSGTRLARRSSRRLERTHRAVRAAPHVHQLRHTCQGRCQLARSEGQLHGHHRCQPRFQAARRQGTRHPRRLPQRDHAARERRPCLTASLRGGSTMAATPTRPT